MKLSSIRRARKFVTALVGGAATVGIAIINRRYGIDLGPFQEDILAGIGSALTAAAVYLVPNEGAGA